MKLGEKFFDMPIGFIAECELDILEHEGSDVFIDTVLNLTDVSDQMRLETDFNREARNSTRALEDIQSEPLLRDRVTVPPVYWERTGERIMTADWYVNSPVFFSMVSLLFKTSIHHPV